MCTNITVSLWAYILLGCCLGFVVLLIIAALTVVICYHFRLASRRRSRDDGGRGPSSGRRLSTSTTCTTVTSSARDMTSMSPTGVSSPQFELPPPYPGPFICHGFNAHSPPPPAESIDEAMQDQSAIRCYDENDNNHTGGDGVCLNGGFPPEKTGFNDNDDVDINGYFIPDDDEVVEKYRSPVLGASPPVQSSYIENSSFEERPPYLSDSVVMPPLRQLSYERARAEAGAAYDSSDSRASQAKNDDSLASPSQFPIGGSGVRLPASSSSSGHRYHHHSHRYKQHHPRSPVTMTPPALVGTSGRTAGDGQSGGSSSAGSAYQYSMSSTSSSETPPSSFSSTGLPVVLQQGGFPAQLALFGASSLRARGSGASAWVGPTGGDSMNSSSSTTSSTAALDRHRQVSSTEMEDRQTPDVDDRIMHSDDLDYY